MFRLKLRERGKVVRAAPYCHRTKMDSFSLIARLFESDAEASGCVYQITPRGYDPISSFPLERYFNFFHFHILPLLLRYPGPYSYARLRARGHCVSFYRQFLAFIAHSPHPQTMMRRLKAEFVRHFVLHLLDLRREKFDHLAALRADHVVVMLVIVMMLVIGLVVTESYLTRESGFGQKLQRAVNGGMPYGRVFLLDQPVKIFARQVLLGAEEYIEDQVALARSAKSCLLDMLEENFPFLLKFFLLFRHIY
jgi:hypothetical protein